MDNTFDAAAEVVRQVLVDQAGDDNPARLARNVLHALREAGLWHPRLAPSDVGALRVHLRRLDAALAGMTVDRGTGQAGGQLVPSAPPAAAPATAITTAVLDAVDLWNDLARRCELPRVTKVTGPRRTLLAARLLDCGGLDGWTAALAKIEANPFFTGLKPGRDGSLFKADIDFIIKESVFTRLMEGGYDERPAAPNAAGGTHAGNHHPSGRRGADQRGYGTVDGGEAARRGILDGLADELGPQHPG